MTLCPPLHPVYSELCVAALLSHREEVRKEGERERERERKRESKVDGRG